MAGRDTDEPGEARARARAAVVERLRARRSEIDEAIFARISDQWFDRTGSGDPEYVAGLRAAGVAALDYVLVGMERLGESLERVPVAVLEQARRAARTGVGLETVLRRYLAGYVVVEGFVVQETERAEQDLIPPTHGLRDMLADMSALVDRLITAVSRAYGEEIEGAGSSPARSGRPPASAQRHKQSGGAGGGSSRTREHVVRDQRARTSRRDRILEAMVEVVSERGFAGASVKLVTARAGVSTRTFYEEFDGLRECFEAVLDLALERAGGLIVQAYAREERWQDGVLGALASLLVFFDSEPALTRVWFVEALAAGSWALARREQVAGMLRSMIVEHWVARGDQAPDPVAATGVMASVLGLIHTHLVTEQPEPLIELLGPLMGLVTSLYLDKQDVAREVQRGVRVAREIQAGEVSWALPPAAPPQSEPTLPAILTNPTARRLRACVLYLAEQDPQGPGPSNREIGTAVGAVHKSQISKLLSQLQAEDLAVKGSVGPGGPNEWRLTPRGENIAGALAGQED